MEILKSLQSSAICPAGESRTTCGVDWSPEDQRFVMGGKSKIIRMVAEDGSQQWEGSGHTDWIRAVRWAPEGGFVATGSDDKTIRLWDVDTGNCTKKLDGGHSDWVRALDVSPDGQWVVSGSDDKKVIVWDVSAGTQKWSQTKHNGFLYSLRFSPDGETVASGGGGDHKVRIWRTSDGKLLHTLQGHDADVHGLAWSPDGAQLASVDSDGALIFWDPDSGSKSNEFKLPKKGSALAWSPDGTTLMVGSDVGVMAVEADTGKVLETAGIGHVVSVAIAADGQTMVAGLNAAGARTFTIEGAGAPMGAATPVEAGDEVPPALEGARGRCLGHLEVSAGAAAPAVALSADGQQMLVGRPAGLGMWKLGADVGVTTEWNAHEGGVLAVDWARSVDVLASGGADKSVQIWDAKTQACTHTLSGHRAAICAVHFSADGQRLASSDAEGAVRVWEVSSGRCLQELSVGNGWCRSVKWSPCGRMLAATNDEGGVIIWETADFSEAHNLQGHSGWVHDVDWSHKSTHVVSCGEDMRAIIWDLAKGGQTELAGHTGAVTGVAWSASSARIITAGDNTVRQWDPQRGKQVSMSKDNDGYPEKVLGMLAFCITSHTDGYIFAWSL